jgi:hypothetical protein
LRLKFVFRDGNNSRIGDQEIILELWITYDKPKGPLDKQVHLKRALEWASGAGTREEMAEKIMNGIHARSGWYYRNGGPPGGVKALVEGFADWGNCRTMANVWSNLLSTMGVGGVTPDGHTGRNGIGFMAPTGIRAFGNRASANGNARGFVDPRFDRWVFDSHWFGKMGTRYYDPTFNLIGDSFYYHIDYDIVAKDGTTITTSPGGPTIYHWESNFAEEEGNWPKFRYRFPIFGKTSALAEEQTGDAHFTGSYTETTTDSDGDGIFEQLGAVVGVDIREPGLYTVTGILQRNSDFISSRSFYFDASMWVEAIGPEAGNYEIQAFFSGEEIFRSGLPGPYEMWLMITDSTGAVAAADTFTTAAYVSTQFGEFPTRLAQLAETAVDIDSDGFFDEILVEIDLALSRPISATVDVSVQHSGRTLVSTSETKYLPEGNNPLKYSLPASGIAASGLNGPYTLSVGIVDQDGEQTAYREIQTADYVAGQFTLPIVRITSGSSDAGSDTDGDGLYDILEVSLIGDVQEEGFYAIRAWLGDESGEQITWALFEDSFSAGSIEAVLNFPGKIIHESQLDGPYVIVYVTVTDEEGNLIFTGNDLYVTNAYSTSQFAPEEEALITFTGNINEHSIDSDANGLIDSLIIELEVVPRDSGNVVAYGRLVNEDGRTLLWSSTVEFLDEGNPQPLFLSFDGRYIYGGLMNGPYHLRNLQIYHVGDPDQNIVLDEAYTTQFYNYENFEPAGVITGTAADSIGNTVSGALLLVPDQDHDYTTQSGKYNLVLLEENEYLLKISGPDTLHLEWEIYVNGNFRGTGRFHLG